MTVVLMTVAFVSCAPHARVTRPNYSAPQEPETRFDGKPLSYWMQALQDPNKDTRISAASALAKIGAPAQPAVPLLIAALKDEEKLVRTNSIAALGKIGPAAADALPALIELSRDSDWATRSLATAAAAAIHGKPLPRSEAQDKVQNAPRSRAVRPPS